MELGATNTSPMQTAISLLGQAARESRDNKYAQAAKEVASLDWQFPQLTGPPLNATGLQGGFIDILV